MITLTCNCLNIKIELESNELLNVHSDSLELKENESENLFFKQELYKINKLKDISKKHNFLVKSDYLGNWIINNCINCKLFTHAIHKEYGANFVLITKALKNCPSIEEIKKSDFFSNVFDIVVFLENITSLNHNVEVLSPDLELAVNHLKQIASASISRETALVEKRIRKFTEEENAALEAFREKTRAEQSFLSKLLISSKVKFEGMGQDKLPIEKVQKQTNLSIQPQVKFKKEKSPFTSDMSPTTSAVIATKKLKSSPRNVPIRQLSTPVKVDSNDTEGLFLLDGDDETKNQNFNETLDSSDNEELPKERQQSISINIAKSLPINIPIFMSSGGGRSFEDENEVFLDSSEDNPSDIAASIKALAKSVHGDAVFGDLPRPRVCTNHF